ncbi:Iota-carrageenase [Tenacibaculum sp. M341]|uniref:Iota-carrageenase n=1 Tax=Tenacibaculum sp. M341 TaxID=2530339 RepID=UPI001047BEB1|nr:Iota-carrageenase [Tenacibaculum sp. M341]TCI84414.1 Iota-carrageenase [Tenacibaculum sp. M341]
MKKRRIKVLKSVYLTFLTTLILGCSSNVDEVMENDETTKLENNVQARINSNISRFYKAPENFEIINNIQFNNNKNDDSVELQTAIDNMSDDLGVNDYGKIIIPKGEYYLADIIMKSNITIEVEEETIIHAGISFKNNQVIFGFGDKTGGIENSALIGTGSGFVIDLRKNKKNRNMIVCAVRDVENFMISNFIIEDKISVFASILVDITDVNGPNWPKNGVIQKIDQKLAHRGYGLIQAYAANKVLFKDLSCDGGVTLRIETDNRLMKELNKGKNVPNIGGVRNVFAENISNRNGLAALMLSPHFMKNGRVVADNISSVNSSFTVRVERGFVEIFAENNTITGDDHKAAIDSIYGSGSVAAVYKRGGGIFVARLKPEFANAAFNEVGFKAGTFSSNTTITNVSTTYGNTGHMNFNHRLYMPCEERNTVYCRYKIGKDAIFHGPTLAAVFNNNIEGSGPETTGSFRINIDVDESVLKSFPPGIPKTVIIDNNTAEIRGRRDCKVEFKDCPIPTF